MQSLTWYLYRLQAMSPGEVGWRVRSALRDLVESRQLPTPPPVDAAGAAAFRLSDVEVGEWAAAPTGAREGRWRQQLLAAADSIASHRLTFFGLREKHLGDPIDWNTDHESGRRAPRRRAAAIDYRDPRVAGDAKLVWEPNRHHQLVVLGRAYRASGHPRYAQAVAEQLHSWLEQCPFGQGMNWRSPLELALRLISWAWTLDLIHESGALARDLRSRLFDSAYLHLREVSRNYSRGSSANNHRIGEAVGVFVGSSYFSGFPEAGRWREESRQILEREVLAQTHADGGSREEAAGYHMFVLELLLVAGTVARRQGQDFSASYWNRLEKMTEFLGALAEGGERVPSFGDSDDAYVLDLGGERGDPRRLLALGAAAFGRPALELGAADDAEPVRWLLGREALSGLDAQRLPTGDTPLLSRAFVDSGYYLLQSGTRQGGDGISVFFDCAELGLGPIAAHGHADALSFTLRAFGKDVFVDPGTYDYFTFPEWRRYFRSTRAHNTVVVDGADQSQMLGSFLWGARAQTRCLSWSPRPEGGSVAGEHDGYRSLAGSVRHRRTLELDGVERTLTIRDEIAGQGRHEIGVHFHLGQDCRMDRLEGGRCEIAVKGGAAVTLEVDPRLSLEAVSPGHGPGGGWVSRGYHQRVKSTSLVGRGVCAGDTTFVCRVAVGRPLEGSEGGRRRTSLERGGGAWGTSHG